MVKDLFNVIGPYIHLESLHSTQFHLPFHLHFINHWEPKLRQTYQPANGGPVPACTPWHTWISLITSLALPDYSRLYSVVDCQLDCMCVSFKSWSSRRVRVCVCVCIPGGVWLLIAHHILESQKHISSNFSHVLWLKQCPDTLQSQSHQAYHWTLTKLLLQVFFFLKSLIKDQDPGALHSELKCIRIRCVCVCAWSIKRLNIKHM